MTHGECCIRMCQEFIILYTFYKQIRIVVSRLGCFKLLLLLQHQSYSIYSFSHAVVSHIYWS